MSDTVIVYDTKLKRPGCVLLQAAMGGDPEAAKRFDTETWLLAPTPDMRPYRVTLEQLRKLVAITEAAR